MNNLHRHLAPISHEAWEQIEQEASRTLKRHLAGRRVVDVVGPRGFDVSAVGTGHLKPVASSLDGVETRQREVKAFVELRVPFKLARQAIDDVDRGAEDSDWSPIKDAARKIAFAEDRAIFDGYVAAGIQGIREGSSNAVVALPANVKSYPDAVAQAVSGLRLAGCNGPYALVLGADAYTAASGGSDEGYPVLHHIERLVDGGIVNPVPASLARARTSGISKAKAISAPVFMRCMRATVPRSSWAPTRSIIWPPHMPLAPEAAARRRQSSARILPSSQVSGWAMISKAVACRESPARTAVASS